MIPDQSTLFFNVVGVSGVGSGDESLMDAANNQVIVPSASQYEIAFTPELATANTATSIRVRISVNGSRTLLPENRVAATAGMGRAAAETVRTAEFAAGDTIQSHVSQNTGGPINVTSLSSPVIWQVG